MRSKGVARASSYTWDKIGEQYVELYEQVSMPRKAVGDRGLEIIVVAYRSAALLRSCLEPVAHLPVTVVDNSSDAEVRALCHALGVRYLDSGRNGGFAYGVNHGLAHRVLSEADVLLLNPDAVVDEVGIRALHRALLGNPRLASVGPRQVDGNGRPSRVAWPLPSPWGAVVESLGLGRWRRDNYVIGSVLLLRAEALRQVGPFDESFFLYAEETDWARRATDLGWRHELVTGVTATHIGAATSPDPARRDAHFHASQERFHRKHFGTLGWQVTRFATVAGAAVRAVVLRGERAAGARDRLVRYLRGPLDVESTFISRRESR